MAVVVEVVRTPDSGPVTTTSGVAVVEVAGPPVLANTYISATPPPNPYDGQIWIDIS